MEEDVSMDDQELSKNTRMNSDINSQILYMMKYQNASWNDIAVMALNDAQRVQTIQDPRLLAKTIREYRILYFKLLNLPDRLVDASLKPHLYNVLQRWGGVELVGKGRRKTRGRKKLRKTIRKK